MRIDNYTVYGPTSFAIEAEKLKDSEFEDAKQASQICEEHWFHVSKKIGQWIPTRELAMGAYRLTDNVSYKLEKKLRAVQIIVAAEGIAIAGLGLLFAAVLL